MITMKQVLQWAQDVTVTLISHETANAPKPNDIAHCLSDHQLMGIARQAYAAGQRDMREACAKLCDSYAAKWYSRPSHNQHHIGAATGADKCADAIRALEIEQ